MRIDPPHQTISLTITLTSFEYQRMVKHGMYCLRELGDLGVVQSRMPIPDTPDTARDVAIFGVQEMIAAHIQRPFVANHAIDHDDETPF